MHKLRNTSLLVAAAAALVVFAGFARTYYLKGVFDTPALSPLVHAHGLAMTLWVALFIAQLDSSGKPAAIGQFLAVDAVLGPRHGRQTLGVDVLLAVQADAVASLVDPGQAVLHLTQQTGLAVEIADGQLTLGGVLDLVERVGALLDCNCLAVPEHAGQFGLFGLQNLLEFG